MLCLVKHQMLFALYLTLPRLFDDSNLLYSNISRGDEMKTNKVVYEHQTWRVDGKFYADD
jgi:hypothetical protein